MKLYIGNTRLSKPFLMNHPVNNGLSELKLNRTKHTSHPGSAGLSSPIPAPAAKTATSRIRAL